MLSGGGCLHTEEDHGPSVKISQNVVTPTGAVPYELANITLPTNVINAPDQLLKEEVQQCSVTDQDKDSKPIIRTDSAQLPEQPITGIFQVQSINQQVPAMPPTNLAPVLPIPQPLPRTPAPYGALQGPIVSEAANPPRLTSPQVRATDRPLPINLATALQLADARPLIISSAQASVQEAVAQLDRARVMWLPNVYAGMANYFHTGGAQGVSGNTYDNNRDALLLGGGVTAVFATTDAIFTPLALRQVLKAREYDLRAAQNDALMNVADAYFNVLLARGRLAGAQDTVQKGQELTKTIRALSTDLTSPIEIDRSLAELADLEQEATSSRQDWRVSSAGLTRVLRLDPAAVVDPLEPPFIQVTLISPRESVDSLIPVGLTTRPELGAQQALVQATLVRLKQERLRPLLPSVLLTGNPASAAPGGYLMGGAFYSDTNGRNPNWSGRFDPSIQVVWELQNLGFGNAATVRERRAQNQRALLDLFRVQDQVAADVVEAHAQLESATERVAQAEVGLKEAQTSFQGNLKGLSQTTRFGDRLTLVIRPQEAVVSLRQLGRAYNNYFQAIRDYNQAQFRLYRALGYPARAITCERPVGEVQPVETSRPPEMAAVTSPPPCAGNGCSGPRIFVCPSPLSPLYGNPLPSK
jgi:outer membrane protein TolC